ncbi:hypothetical protein EMIT0111MI5_110178 [Burkholderia sp. IT-111MI5]
MDLVHRLGGLAVSRGRRRAARPAQAWRHAVHSTVHPAILAGLPGNAASWRVALRHRRRESGRRQRRRVALRRRWRAARHRRSGGAARGRRSAAQRGRDAGGCASGAAVSGRPASGPVR